MVEQQPLSAVAIRLRRSAAGNGKGIVNERDQNSDPRAMDSASMRAGHHQLQARYRQDRPSGVCDADWGDSDHPPVESSRSSQGMSSLDRIQMSSQRIDL